MKLQGQREGGVVGICSRTIVSRENMRPPGAEWLLCDPPGVSGSLLSTTHSCSETKMEKEQEPTKMPAPGPGPLQRPPQLQQGGCGESNPRQRTGGAGLRAAQGFAAAYGPTAVQSHCADTTGFELGDTQSTWALCSVLHCTFGKGFKMVYIPGRGPSVKMVFHLKGAHGSL